MELKEFIRKTEKCSRNTMLIWSDGKGWTNLKIKIEKNAIKLLPDYNMPFDD